MNNKKQSGFSLIELLLVLVIIGVLATITFPFLYSAKQAAENKSAFASLRTISSGQVGFFSQNGRFARLDELNSAQMNGLGTVTSNVLKRDKFTFTMTPSVPTDAQLRSGYSITVTKAVAGSEVPYVISLNQSGQIVDPFTPNQ